MGKVRILIIFVLAVVKMCSGCTVEFGEQGPLIVKKFGSKEIILRGSGYIQLEPYESVKLYCDSEITLEYSRSDLGNYLELICKENNKLYSIENEYLGNSQSRFNCYKRVHSLYETRHPLYGCKNFTSFGIGTVFSTRSQSVIAGICYDLTTLSMKFVSYLAYKPKYEFLSNISTAPSISDMNKIMLSQKISNSDIYFKSWSQELLQNDLEIKKKANPLLQEANFDYSSIVQDDAMQKELESYKGLLNIIWWRNLREGNWKYFLNALEEQSKKTKYNVFVGTHEELLLPSSTCNTIDVLSVNFLDTSIVVPKYIWAFLQEKETHSTKDFVVIGLNSPYYDSTMPPICKDICDEIDWIVKGLLRKTKSMPFMGMFYCCHLDDLENVDIIQNIKIKNMEEVHDSVKLAENYITSSEDSRLEY